MNKNDDDDDDKKLAKWAHLEYGLLFPVRKCLIDELDEVGASEKFTAHLFKNWKKNFRMCNNHHIESKEDLGMSNLSRLL